MNPSKPSSFGCTIWLSLASAPFLLSYLALESLTGTLIEFGLSSEELFRGNRLPILHFPDFEVEGEDS
jgi:hypothetical protein